MASDVWVQVHDLKQTVESLAATNPDTRITDIGVTALDRVLADGCREAGIAHTTLSGGDQVRLVDALIVLTSLEVALRPPPATGPTSYMSEPDFSGS